MNDQLLTFAINKRFPDFTLECKATFGSGITGVFGVSGSGKTTLLNCIAGLISPDYGEIDVLGQTVYSSSNGVNVPPERRRFGYVFQDSGLFPHLSVRENIFYGYRLTSVDHRRISPDHLVNLFQLSPLMDRNVANLSGGERQRVSLARALAISPQLILLDEPLASLDVGLRGVIIKYLKQVWRELNIPMVYVSHSLSEIVALAQSTIVLRGGKTLVYGRTSSVLVHPAVSQITDYASFDNILESRIVSNQTRDGLTELSVGNVRMVASNVIGQIGDEVIISVRAGEIIIALEAPPIMSAPNIVKAVVDEIHVLGTQVLVYVDVGLRLVVNITLNSLNNLTLKEQQEIYLILETSSLVVLGDKH